MKLSHLSALLLPLAAWAAEVTDEQLGGGAVAAPLVLEQVDVQVVFADAAHGGVVEITNDHETAVQFVVKNNEKKPIVVSGFGGAFLEKAHKKTGESSIYANLTTTKLPDTEVAPGETKSVEHKLLVTLPPRDFDLQLTLLTVYDNSQAGLVPLPKFGVSIVDEPISWFDPRLVFVQLLLAATVLGVGYVATKTYLLPYLEPKKSAADKKKKNVEKASGSASGINLTDGKTYDESWIPEHHLKQKKKA